MYRNPGATRIASLHPKKHVAAFIFKYFSIQKESGSNKARPHVTTTNIEEKKKEGKVALISSHHNRLNRVDSLSVTTYTSTVHCFHHHLILAVHPDPLPL